MKSAVPGKIIDPCRGLEENDRRAVGLRFCALDSPGKRRNFEIIKSAYNSALDALSEEFVEHDFVPNLISKFQAARESSVPALRTGRNQRKAGWLRQSPRDARHHRHMPRCKSSHPA